MTFADLMQVLTAGQELVFDYQGDMFILRPLSMMIAASQDKSAQQGLLTETTAMTFEAHPHVFPMPENCGRADDTNIFLCKMCYDAVWNATAATTLSYLALRTVQYLVWEHVLIREAQCLPRP